MQVGDVLLICYQIPGAPLFHERIICAVAPPPAPAGRYVVLTPDDDQYVEDCVVSADNQEVLATRGLGDSPAILGRRATYRFGAVPSLEEMAAWEAHGAAMVGAAPPAVTVPARVAGAAAVPFLPLVAIAPPADGGAAPPALPPLAAPPGLGGGVAAPAPPAVAAGAAAVAGRALPWIYWEPTALRSVGDPIALGGDAVRHDPLALVKDPDDETKVVVARVVKAGEDAATLVAERMRALAVPDARVCSLRYGPDGRRHRNFRDATDLMMETAFHDFPLTGPRTCAWLVTAMGETSTGPVARHSRWAAESGVPASDRSRYEHEILSRAFELGVCYDGLNPTNLACFELLARRLQLLEESHLEDPLHPTFQGARHFMGTGERRGGALVAPSLQSHVAEQLRGEAAVAKERRKARESSTLTTKSWKGDKGNQKGGAKGGGSGGAAPGDG